jgi:hypothetical protein
LTCAGLALALLFAGCGPQTAATPDAERASAAPPRPTATTPPTNTPLAAAPAAPVSADVRQLIEELDSEDAVERAEAAHALGLLGSEAEAASPRLILLLDDNTTLFALFGLATTSPAQESAIALARIGQSQGVERLVSDLRSGDRALRARAVTALATSRDAGLDTLRAASPSDELLEVAIDPRIESRLRGQAIRLLGRLRDPATVDTLGGLLQDPNAVVRTATASALGEIADCHAIPWLLDAMARADSAERFLLDAVLTQITARTFGNDTRAWQEWWAGQTCPPVE